MANSGRFFLSFSENSISRSTPSLAFLRQGNTGVCNQGSTMVHFTKSRNTFGLKEKRPTSMVKKNNFTTENIFTVTLSFSPE